VIAGHGDFYALLASCNTQNVYNETILDSLFYVPYLHHKKSIHIIKSD
jgi:hypothetical protein